MIIEQAIVRLVDYRHQEVLGCNVTAAGHIAEVRQPQLLLAAVTTAVIMHVAFEPLVVPIHDAGRVDDDHQRSHQSL